MSSSNSETQRPSTKRVGYYFVFVVFSTVISSFMFAFQAGLINTAGTVIHQCLLNYTTTEVFDDPNVKFVGLPMCLPMDDWTWGLIVALFSVGGLVGSIISGYLAERFGRKPVILHTSVLLLAGSLVSGFSANVAMFGAGRFIIGFAIGINSMAVSLFIVEISPVHLRGTIGSMPQLANVLGFFACSAISLPLSTIYLWRYLFLIAAFPHLLQIVLTFFTVESPRYLISIGKQDDAKTALTRLRSHQNVDEEFKHLKRTINGDAWQSTTKYTLITLLKDRTLRRSIYISIFLQFMQQLVGINTLVYYSTLIIKNIYPDISGLITVMISILNIVSTLIGVYLIDRAGRKVLLYYSTGTVVVAWVLFLIASGLNIGQLAITALLLFIFGFAFGLGPIPWIMMAEVFPTSAVSLGASIGCTAYYILVIIIAVVFPAVYSNFGSNAFYPFLLFSVLSFFYTWKYLPETKNRDIDEILKDMNK